MGRVARYYWMLVITVVVALVSAASAGEPSPADAAFFEREIRPLLVERCHKCHGDQKEPKGALALTSREAVLRGGDSGPAAIEGKPQDSPLIAAIKHVDGLEMPPDEPPLSAVEVARLERWVELGLPWPQTDPAMLRKMREASEAKQIAAAKQNLWSLKKVTRPALPEVKNVAWPRMPVDRFVLASLESHGLSPSPVADRNTLVRRLSFDLTGLPPTPEETAEFLRDESPLAVERLVDRLLASPRYGERWGRHWLDVARYADNKGYVLFQDSNFPWSYTYRDYVVRSFNEDLPYDRFIVEQLAADQLPLGNDKRALTALGFLTLGNGFMNNQQDVLDDRIDVITRGLLGLTVSCARCHDHKFDPIPTADYYSLYGVLASSVEPVVPPLFEPPPDTSEYHAFARELEQRQQKLNAYVDMKFRAIIAGARSRADEYLLAAQALADKPPTDDFMLLADGNDLNPTMIIRYQTFLARSRERGEPVMAIWHALAAIPPAEFSQTASKVLAETIASASAERPVSPLVAAAFHGQPLAELADAARIYAELFLGRPPLLQAAFDRQRFAVPGASLSLDDELAAISAAIDGPEAPAGLPRYEINDLALLPDRPSQAIRSGLVKAIEDWRANGPAAPPRAMVLEDLPVPVRPRVFTRGNPNNLGDEVPRRFLRVLANEADSAVFTQGSGRLELARAIADPQNPLTARVMVNRVWLAHFGAPLVTTPSDFGTRSTPPVHGELLDYLAASFVESGWSVKALHRQIVLSAAYQQSSADRTECRQVDPENVWLWRMNRRRLDFESTRDSLLAVSNRLSSRCGGPAVSELNAPTATRRTLYNSIDRLNLPSLFRTFDFPNPDATSPQRVDTIVPQQALFFMNHPLTIEAAKNLLTRAEVAAQTEPAAKLRQLYLTVYAREPAAEEQAWCAAYLQAAGPDAWPEIAQGLLQSNEFIFVD